MFYTLFIKLSRYLYYRVLRCVFAEILEPPLSIAICARLCHEINLIRDTSCDAALRDVEKVLRRDSNMTAIGSFNGHILV